MRVLLGISDVNKISRTLAFLYQTTKRSYLFVNSSQGKKASCPQPGRRREEIATRDFPALFMFGERQDPLKECELLLLLNEAEELLDLTKTEWSEAEKEVKHWEERLSELEQASQEKTDRLKETWTQELIGIEQELRRLNSLFSHLLALLSRPYSVFAIAQAARLAQRRNSLGEKLHTPTGESLEVRYARGQLLYWSRVEKSKAAQAKREAMRVKRLQELFNNIVP